MRVHRKMLVPLVAIATVMSLAACASAGTSTPDPSSTGQAKAASLTDLKLKEPVDITIGLNNPTYSFGAAILLAKELGVFEDFGLNVTFENINGVDALALLARGDIDIQDGTFGAGFFNGISQGLAVRCLATTKVTSEDSPEALYARPGLFADPAHPTAAEIKGSTQGSAGGPTSSSMNSYEIFYEKEFGLSVTDFNVVQMAATDQLVALTNGSIDIGYLTAPLYLEAESRGITRLGALTAPAQCTQAGPRVVDNPDIGAAYLAAVEYTAETYLGPGHLDNDVVVNAIAKATGLDASVVRGYVPAEFKVRALDPEILSGAQDTFRKLGVLDYDKNLDYEQVFAAAAVERLP